MRRRNRFITFLALPLAVFFWVIGWSLSWIGSEKRRGEANKKPDRKELTLAVLMPDQEYAKQQTLAG
jgi:hypothetical protein